jgi:electron transport complex protein RnfB
MSQTKSIDALEAVLPGTQCGLCDYPGCRPYAEAIARGETDISRCAPGGLPALEALAQLTEQAAEPFKTSVIERYRAPQTAIIREEECIGCTKCIPVCPVDAIVGASRQMHTIVTDACNGCELCIPACPVDCIELKPTGEQTTAQRTDWQQQNHQRAKSKEARLAKQSQAQKTKHLNAKLDDSSRQQTVSARQSAILEALARSKAKKGQP